LPSITDNAGVNLIFGRAPSGPAETPLEEGVNFKLDRKSPPLEKIKKRK